MQISKWKLELAQAPPTPQVPTEVLYLQWQRDDGVTRSITARMEVTESATHERTMPLGRLASALEAAAAMLRREDT